MMTLIAIVIALFFAMNIGASGAAATMGPAYGSEAIKRRWLALLFVAVGVLLGSWIGSGEVVKTIGGGIIPADILTVNIVVIILVSAALTLFIANLLGIPLSTSEITVGSVVGVGVAYHALFVDKVLVIVLLWLVIPFIAFSLAMMIGLLIKRLESRFPQLRNGPLWRRLLSILLIAMGILEAFSAGMNNVANAIGPLVGAGLIELTTATWLGGIFIALGALLLGGRVLETNGKKITSLSLLQGSAISGIGGTLVIIASIFGIPVPLTQITTSAIMGMGTADHGFKLWQKNIISQIIKVWIASPVVALVLSYSLIKALIDPQPYALIAVISMFVATLGVLSLYHSVRKEKQTSYEEGSGI